MSNINRIIAPNDDRIDLREEKAVRGDTRNGCDRKRGLLRVCDDPEGHIQDVVALIRQKRIIILQSEGHRNSEIGKARSNELSGKRENFDGKRKAAEPPYDLAGVDHGYDASRCRSNNLFP